jgi:hypothetical protein
LSANDRKKEEAMIYDLELVKKYKPVIMMDKEEPFTIDAMGYTLFRETRRSSSFPKRKVEINTSQTAFAIEYAIWYDYDIQHLYELEHLWVYVGHDGAVRKVEASFHGKYLNMIDLETGEPNLWEETHPVVYAQPGKHALVPDQRVIRMIPDWRESCMEKAGMDGVLVQDMFEEEIHTDEELQKMTERYIKEVYGFVPSMEFRPFLLENDKLMTWEELKVSIPGRVNGQIQVIREYFSK